MTIMGTCPEAAIYPSFAEHRDFPILWQGSSPVFVIIFDLELRNFVKGEKYRIGMKKYIWAEQQSHEPLQNISKNSK